MNDRLPRRRRPHPPWPRLALAALAPALTGCAVIAGALFVPEEGDGTRLSTVWAQKARAVRSPDTPETPRDLEADFGPPDDRDRDDLVDLHELPAAELGEVVVRLEPGVYRLTERVLLRGAPLVIEGPGSHAVRLELDTKTPGSLLVVDAPRVVLRGLTVVGLTGGGIGLKGCPDVVVEDVSFAGARTGLDLEGSIAAIGSSVFDGCAAGLSLSGGADLTLRSTAFFRCWDAVKGRARVDAEACVFVDNKRAMPLTFSRGSRVESALLAGTSQDLAWVTRPSTIRAVLGARRDVGDKLPEAVSRPLHLLEEFPRGLQDGLPPGFALAAVHIALERQRVRGDRDPPARLDELRASEAERHARVAREALAGARVEDAREAVRVALAYWGDRPLADAPEGLVELAALALE